MPRTDIVFYQDGDGRVPVLEWLETLRGKNENAYGRCVAAIGRLAALGHELRRPLAGTLRGGVYELRIRNGRVNIRILYFFHGRGLAILAHALTKEDIVPAAGIERAVRRKLAFESNPKAHTYVEGGKSNHA
jgi:phage-related protein